MSDKTDVFQATPRPWILTFHNGSPREERQFSDGGGRPIGICHPHARGNLPAMLEAKANAALIVRAVNAHDKLVAVLRDLIAQIDRHPIPFDGVLPAVNRAIAALAKVAEG